ncbi:diguanylate cyclase [Falsibacillus albus]|uniref:Diguanylate cyclase n=2 Tax=Falsibacillus albus TaxID=2478915 RepID=A0A3L7K7N4_9BACI|nr:diguanylate cyclase [Falsibacillus albus]
MEFKSQLYDLLDCVDERNDAWKIIGKWLELLGKSYGFKRLAFYLIDPVEEDSLILKKVFNVEGELPVRFRLSADLWSESSQNGNDFVCTEDFPCGHSIKTMFNSAFLLKNINDQNAIVFLKSAKEFQVNQEKYRRMISESQRFLDRLFSHFQIMNKERQYKELFRVTEKFHSTMDIDSVLSEIIHTLKRVFPAYEYYLMLSNDDERKVDLPIKDLEYDSENAVAMQSYVNGSVQIEDSCKERRTILYAPLRGKQGVYGVLQVLAPSSLIFPDGQVEFITLLANTAGSALENAKLYQQSKRLISDLQLINDTSHKLNSSLRLTDTIEFLKNQIERYFRTSEIGFIMLGVNEQVKTMDGSSGFFLTAAGEKYIEFVRKKIQKEKDSLFIGDLNNSDDDVEYEYCSLMAIPMVHSNVMIGFCIVLHHSPYAFTFEMYKLFQSLIHHSTLALSNSMLREELERMVITDYLTQLYARNYLDSAIENSMEHEHEGTFILVDIDNFKKINDTYGHQTGDSVIIQVAKLIQQNIRSTDVGARWGGEELAIYLPGASLKVGYSVADRLVKTVQKRTKPSVTVSCGVSYWNKEKTDQVEQLIKRADRALYIAKNNGKNKVVIHERDYRMLV